MNGCEMKGKSKHYKLVPPDGSWGYMVWIAAIINFSALSMFLPSIGMIFNEFYIKTGMGSTDVQLHNGINSMSMAVGGFLTGPMMKLVSIRKISFLGAAFVSVGVFGLVFVNSYALFLFCQGVLLGCGTGILYNVTTTAMNDYFVEKRFMMNSLAQAISAIASIMAPLVIHWTAENYGYRATIIFMASVYLQTLVGSALQQPVKWHFKKVYSVASRENEELLKTKSNCKIQKNGDRSRSHDINIEQMATENNIGFLTYIKDVFDWAFLKVFLRSCACVGAPLGTVSDIMFTLFLPQALYARDWSEGEVAWALLLLSFGDIAMRVLLIVASGWLRRIGSKLIFVVGMAIDVVVKLVFLWFPHPAVTYVMLTLSGCSRCLLIVLYSLVISDVVPPEKYATAFGVCILMYGTFSITIGPAIGAVRDATGNYASMFYLLIALMAAVTLAWSIEIYRDSRKK